MKKILAMLLCLSLLVPCLGAAAESHPLLYEARDDQGHVIYLLGTIHVGGEDMFPLSDAVWRAYNEAEALAVEVDVVTYQSNLLGAIRTVAELVYPFSDSAKNHLSPETYALGVEKLGLNEFVLNRMKPVAWYSLAEAYVYAAVGLSPEMGADYTLLEQAHRDGKRIDELEGMNDQTALMLDLPEEVLDQEIRLTLTYPAESGEGLRQLYDAWRTGDEGALLSVLGNPAEDTDLAAAYDEFDDALLGSRNEGFDAQARAYLEKGETVLIAIGAAHIIGEDGVAARLRRAGYEVKEIGRE